MLCCRLMRLFQDRREDCDAGGTWGCEAVLRDQLLHCADGSKSITEQRELQRGRQKWTYHAERKGVAVILLLYISLYMRFVLVVMEVQSPSYSCPNRPHGHERLRQD